MTERRIIVDQLKFSYEGLFNIEEFYTLITSWFYDKGWDFLEKLNQEQITPTGKQIRIVLEPWKNISDYHKELIRMKIHVTDVKEVDVEFDGKMIRMHQGLIKIIFDGYLITDRHKWWAGNPLTWFFAYVLDKIYWRNHLEKGIRWIEGDVQDLYERIKTYLNSYNYTYRNHEVEEGH